MTENELRFHLEEYRLLKGEHLMNIRFIYDTLIWSVLASGAISAWLLTNTDKLTHLSPFHARAAWFIPFVLALIGFFASRHFVSLVLHTAGYLRRLETACAMEGMGWETSERRNERSSIAFNAGWRMAIVWAVLIIADLALAVFVP